MDHNHQKPRTSKIGNGWRGHFQWKFLLNGPKIFSKYIQYPQIWIHVFSVGSSFVVYLCVSSQFIPNLSELH